MSPEIKLPAIAVAIFLVLFWLVLVACGYDPLSSLWRTALSCTIALAATLAYKRVWVAIAVCVFFGALINGMWGPTP